MLFAIYLSNLLLRGAILLLLTNLNRFLILQISDIRERHYEKMGIGSSYLFRLDDGYVVSEVPTKAHPCSLSCLLVCFKLVTSYSLLNQFLEQISSEKIDEFHDEYLNCRSSSRLVLFIKKI